MDKLKETAISRKFLVMLSVVILAAIMFNNGRIDSEQMIGMIEWATGVYVGSLGAVDASKNIGKVLGNFLK